MNTVSKYGLIPIMEIGEGSKNLLPKYGNSIADPNLIGKQVYLAYQYRFCRAAVHRYKDVVDLYQVGHVLFRNILIVFN